MAKKKKETKYIEGTVDDLAMNGTYIPVKFKKEEGKIIPIQEPKVSEVARLRALKSAEKMRKE